MGISWVRKLTFICILSIVLLSQAFGQSLILDSIRRNSVLINHQSLVDFLHADPKTAFVIDGIDYPIDHRDKLNKKLAAIESQIVSFDYIKNEGQIGCNPNDILVICTKEFLKMKRAKSKIVQQDTIRDPLPEINEVFPEPPDGSVGFKNWVISHYEVPTAAKKAKVNGKLIINFTVGEDGKLSNFQIAKDIGYQTGEALITLIRKSSPWKPGFQNGHAVKCRYTFPLLFSAGMLKLENDARKTK
ncbi:energy transducer TonB [Sphingobacterium sp. HMA12]|uniref:energy transducer TonB n=1 Tax=Sphingobacterium sp. HMA12 TaxID=2050894 RepID=UPI000CEA5B04|nr:energy transducer TonB [Sphingobacterium sp. HMA12]